MGRNSNDNIEWLQDWSIMIDALSDNDILQKPHGSCLNSTYHDRLHPHTTAIFNEPLDTQWESCNFEEYSNPYYLNQDNQNMSTISNPIKNISNPFSISTKNAKTNKNEEKDNQFCQIYDTVQHEYLKHYISPFLVTLAIRIGAVRQNNKITHFKPKLLDNLSDEQQINNRHKYGVAESFRQHPIDGNFDFPTTRAWFDYYHEFVSTVCISE